MTDQEEKLPLTRVFCKLGRQLRAGLFNFNMAFNYIFGRFSNSQPDRKPKTVSGYFRQTTMTEKELTNKLTKIGYTNLWLDYGVLTVEYLIAQEQTFDNSDDQNTEHYRYHTLRHYLSFKNSLSDKEFDNYLKLTFNDPDTLMAGSATVDLFNKIDLTNLQFEKLCATISFFGDWTEKVIVRQKLLRLLRTTKLTGDLFNECIVNGDSVIHEYILDIANYSQLRELIINGKNKKIKNIAKEKFDRLTRQQNSR